MSRSHLWYGPNGTGKTHAALKGASTDEPTAYFEWEPSGFRRGAAGLNLNEGSVAVHKFRVPTPELESLGEVKVTAAGNAMPQVSFHLEGWVECISEFNQKFTAACKAGQRPVVDTVTRLWLAQRQAFEQQVQDATGKDAEKLSQLKFTMPNARMIGMAEYAERYDLDIILISHEDTVFNSNPPIAKPDTMKELPNLVDVVLRFRIVGNRPVATITKAAEGGMDLVGMEIEEPSLIKVNALLDSAAAIRARGLPMTGLTPESIIEQGQALGAR